ncbi:interleukin-1 receptor type 1 isoform X4 [Heterocephalus glaber]|uniref:Interleukin-1 receptor type 1 isoform X4 n=1 Tax=Heterocephalus glaber TaxID=10181 RepID=A0AAX6T197_HETGA|nr:interleukin-1 receptor type 1 isoform X4 [Heterocephalus glaber]
MKVSLRVVYFMALLMSLEADKCAEREDRIILASSANEIAVGACNLNPGENLGPVIWYKNDGKTPVCVDQNCRINQQKEKLWFVPAKVEDSGHYYCAVRNSTYCLKIKITAHFMENEPNLCYNTQVIFRQKLLISGDGRLVCPHLDFLKDENNEFPEVQWFKDCRPLLLDNAHFIGVRNTLLVKNVAPEHRGNYTCQAPYTYLGKRYRISRTIQFLPLVPDFQKHVIGIFVTLTFIITCSVFIYKIFKVDIVLWYRDSCYDFLSQKALDGKIYDAYILYPKTLTEGFTSSSDIFVFKILPEVLEKQLGYKLFIYGRDDYAGEDTVEVFNETIRQSRRLIIILVRDIAGFSWLGHSSEEQIVMYNALIKEGIKVVLVELDKIQDYEKMPESIKFIKQKHGVIRWSGDLREGGQSSKTRFWKNIRYHMPALPLSPASQQQLLPQPSRQDSVETLQKELHLPLR